MTTSSLVIVGKMGQSQSKAFLIKRPSTGDEEDTYYHHSSLLAIGSCKKFGSADPIRGAARPTFPAWTAVVRRRQAACGRAVRRIPFAFTLRVRFTDGYRRGRIFHFSVARALRNGYDSQKRG